MKANNRLGAPPTDYLKINLRMCWSLYQLDMDARNLRPKSHDVAGYACEKIISYFGEATMVGDITSHQLKLYFAELNRNLSPQTVETIFRKAKTWFEFLVKEEILLANPFNNLKNIKLDRTVLPHLKQLEVEQILKTICKPRTVLELRDALIFYTALDTGLRLTELADLQRDDLDLPKLVVRRGKMGKGRIVCVGMTTQRLFQRYLVHLTSISNDPKTLWISANGKQLTPRGVQLIFRRMSKRLGIKIHPHKIRRTTALQYLNSKIDLHTLRQLMGWSSFEMIQRYVAIDATLIEEAVMIASPVDKLSLVSNRKALNRKL